MKSYSFKKLQRITAIVMLTFVNLNTEAQCDAPAFKEVEDMAGSTDRGYANGEVVSRDGVDYKAVWGSWASSTTSDWAYAPGTGSIWQNAWTVESDPCVNTGGGGGGDNDGGGGDNDGGGGDNDGGGGDNDGGGGNGQACTGRADYGHGTWYNNLDVQPNGVVKCSYERDDIVGTKYGALDKGLLLEDGKTKYCGMCVEAIAPENNNVPVIIQIVDECPDCWDRSPSGQILTGTNTKFGDIDLSIAAFKALLQEDHVALGIGDFDWKEVSCPWTNNIHIITQGSHDWYAKIIVGNHVNRIASVEISNDGGSTWNAMELGVDNGWVKGGFGGANKSFKITDVYGSEIITADIDMTTNGDAKIEGSENFPACGLNTSTQEVNTLEYVTAFPNPSNGEITFAGIDEVELIQIIGVTGQVVTSRNLQAKSAQITLDITDFSPGIYVARMTGANKTGIVTFVKK